MCSLCCYKLRKVFNKKGDNPTKNNGHQILDNSFINRLNMTQKMLAPKLEISLMYPLPIFHVETTVLTLTPTYRETLIIKIWEKENKKAFINKKPIYKAKEYELF